MWDKENAKEGVIRFPTGTYKPVTDNIANEINKAIAKARLENCNVKVNGVYVDSPADLPTNSFKEMGDFDIVIEPYDIAG